MRDKGTNEVRAMLTDVTIAVIRRTIDADPDKSQNSIIRDVMDAWARRLSFGTSEKEIRPFSELMNTKNTASIRQRYGRKLPNKPIPENLPRYAVTTPLTAAPKRNRK